MASNLRVDTILPSTGTTLGIGTASGTINFLGNSNIDTSGTLTAASASITGNLGVGGTITYEDVTNIDSVGVVTARSGINVSGGEVKVGTAVTVSSGGVITSGIVTATNVSAASSVTAATFHGSGANLTGLSAGLTMADQWRVSTSQSTSAHTIADITAWSRNNNNFAGVGDALTNSGANFTFPSTGIYYISYNIATYITSGSARYISARLYYNGQDICHSWSSAHHGASSGQTLMSTGSQAIIDVPNTSYTFKIRLQSSVAVTIVGLNEAGYNSSVNMSEVVVMKLGDT